LEPFASIEDQNASKNGGPVPAVDLLTERFDRLEAALLRAQTAPPEGGPEESPLAASDR
jgi:hypothetical protein